MIINHNMASLNTYRQLSTNNSNSAKSLEKLSSGLRINKAGDDAAGLAISEKMRGQIRGLDQAARNSQDAISMIQTAEGSLSETHSILQRMRELAVQGGNDTNTTTDRGEIQKEINSLTSEINRIGNTTEFNSQKLLNATSGSTDGTAGTYKAVLSALFTLNDTITIDGETFTAAATNTATTFVVTDVSLQAAGLAAAIALNATLSAKYTASASTNDVQLVQKAGKGSSTAPIVADSSVAVDTSVTTSTAGVDATKSSFSMQIGANQNQTMTLDFTDMRSKALSISGAIGGNFTAAVSVTDGTNDALSEAALDVSNSTNAGNAVTVIQAAIEKVSAERSKLGANTNRLEHTITNLGTSSENMTGAESRIRDVDMAKEMMQFQKNNILSQAATAMLAQANQQPQGVLQLLR